MLYILLVWKIGEDTSQPKTNDNENHMNDARGDRQGTWTVYFPECILFSSFTISNIIYETRRFQVHLLVASIL